MIMILHYILYMLFIIWAVLTTAMALVTYYLVKEAKLGMFEKIMSIIIVCISWPIFLRKL